MAKLLIVESPGKLKTLRKILGPEWILEASVGHTTELASDGPKRLGFDFNGDKVETRYVPRGDRGKQVLSKLRAAVRNADQVYLATDPDREGEAIAWHLAEQLKLKRYVRVCYTQITEAAVKAAIQKPRSLDFPLIHAQRARQCLDKLVGFEVSPLLWNSTGGKSAGRVQSATLHLVCERERERLAFVPEDYWTLQASYLEVPLARYLPDTPPQKDQDESTRERVRTEAEAQRIERIARTSPHIVHSIDDREERRYPLPPLITSSLQQTAGVRLKFAPQKTMKIAQELYEGVGGQGLITYMRTDTVSLSPEFIQEARRWLKDHAPEALPERPPNFRTKDGAQGAHEAIRPTSVDMTPEKAKELLNYEQYQLYKLIWDRAMASQCSPARLMKGQLVIKAGETTWIARGMRVVEPGYLLFWKNVEDESELPKLRVGQTLNLKDIKIEKKRTEPPSRYSEAKLVQLMEKLGIGRPSTYASTIMTLKEREYVFEDKGALAPTELGMATDEALGKALPDLIDVKFTAQMERSLDQIAEAKLDWEKYLCEWNKGYLVPALANAKHALQGIKRVASDRPASSDAGQRAGAGTGASTGRKRQASRAKNASGSKSRGVSARKRSGTATSKKAAQTFSGIPDCEKGHGALEQRVSKKGDTYFKCPQPGCDSWHWPHPRK